MEITLPSVKARLRRSFGNPFGRWVSAHLGHSQRPQMDGSAVVRTTPIPKIAVRSAMDLQIASLAQRPDLAAVFDEFPDTWPEFMYHDIVSEVLFDQLLRAHPESNVIAIDPAQPLQPLARACAVPYSWPGDLDDGLPPGGYDHVILRGAADQAVKRVRGKARRRAGDHDPARPPGTRAFRRRAGSAATHARRSRLYELGGPGSAQSQA